MSDPRPPQSAPPAQSTPPRPAWRPARRVELALAGLAALVVTGGYVGLAWWHGALGAARNDDWAYYRLLFAFADSGKLVFDPYTSTMLVGQLSLARPVVAVFGEQIAPLQLMVAALSALTLWVSYRVVRGFLSPVEAAFSVACLAAGPIWGGVSVSFMSDVPAMALQVLALAAAARALRGPVVRWVWLALGLLLAFAAFTVREYSVAAVAAILLTLVLRHRRERRVVLAGVGAGLVWLGAAVALFLWRASLVPGERALSARGADDDRVLEILVGLVTTTGFLLFPLAVVVIAALLSSWGARPAGRRSARPLLPWLAVGAALVATFTVVAAALDVPLLTGNYVRLGGSYSGTLDGFAPRVFGPQAWWVLVAVANVSTAVLLTWAAARSMAAWRAHRDPHALAGEREGPDGIRDASSPVGVWLALAFGLATVVLSTAVCLTTGGRPFDRYLVPAVPFLAAAVVYALRRHPDRRPGSSHDRARDVKLGRARKPLAGSASPVVAGVAVLAMGVVGLAQVDASATFDGAKWRLGQQVTALGYDPATVNAGYEWFGFHQPGAVVYRPDREPGFPFWVTDLFRDASVCATARFAPRPLRSAPYSGEVARVVQTSLYRVKYAVYARAVDRGCDR